ncbi:MAG: hypothetical protein HZA54_00135, partial [Planctomycetes bacterium]|nr:hypothetical protein [Planctomycetota bacterium]
VEGLLPTLSKGLNLPVDAFEPFAALDLSALSEADARRVRETPSDLAVALGLAVMDLESPAPALSLLPEPDKARRRFWRREACLIAAAGLLCLGLGTAAVGAAHARSVQEGLRTAVDAAKKEADGAGASFDEQEAKRKETRARLARLAAPVRDGAYAVRVLEALSAARPPALWLPKVAVDPPAGGSADGAPPVITVYGTIGESMADAPRTLSAFLGKLTGRLPGVTTKTRNLKKAADTERTEFEVLLFAPGATATSGAGTDKED